MNVRVHILSAHSIQDVTMDAAELVQKRIALARQAREMFDSMNPQPDHLIYYNDIRDQDSNITEAVLRYEMAALTDDEFYERTRKINGLVGAIHRAKPAVQCRPRISYNPNGYDGYCWNVELWFSNDGGHTFTYAGHGRYFRDLDSAAKYADDHRK